MPKRLNCLGVKKVEKGRGRRGSKSAKCPPNQRAFSIFLQAIQASAADKIPLLADNWSGHAGCLLCDSGNLLSIRNKAVMATDTGGSDIGKLGAGSDLLEEWILIHRRI